MAEIKDVTLKIGVETQDGQNALQQFQKAADQVGKAVDQSSKQTGQSFAKLGGQVSDSASTSEKALQGLGRALNVVLSGALANAAKQFVEFGTSANNLSRGFDALSQKFGVNAVAQLEKLRVATGGVVDKLTLMQQQNIAVTLGLPIEKFDQLSGAAVKLGASLGRTAEESIESLITGLGRQSALMLDNLGILVNAEAAYEKYAASVGKAASKLTDAEKKTAFITEGIDQLQRKASDVPKPIEDMGRAFDGLTTAISDTRTEIAQLLSSSTPLVGFLNSIRDIVRAVPEGVRNVQTGLDVVLNDGPNRELYRNQLEIQSLDKAIAKRNTGAASASRLFGLNGNNLNAPGPDLEGRKQALQLQNQQIVAAVEFDKTMSALDRTTQGYLATNTIVGVNLDKNTTLQEEDSKSKEEARKKAEQLTETIRKQTQAFKEQGLVLEAEAIGDKLEKAIQGLDRGAFDSALTAYREKLNAATAEKLRDELKGSGLSEEVIQARIDAITGPKIQEAQDKFAENQKEAFQESVDFFADILTSTITGTAQDLEDILKNALQRVAVGFGSQLLAALAGSLGLGGIGDLGSAGGLGQALAKALFGEGGSVLKALGVGGPSADFIGPLQPAGSLLASSGVASLGGAAGVAAGAGVGFLQGQGALSVLKGGDLTVAQQAALALPTFGASFAYNPIKDLVGDVFGGDSQKAKEREAREALLDQLFSGDTSFGGTRGSITLSDGNFNRPNSPFADQAIGLANPFAQILTGGDDKLGSDLAGIFSTATTEASSFNEVFVNTLSLMDKLGFDAEEAKSALTDLFLDGKISLDEFTAGIANLNLLMADSLPGIGDINGAFETLGQTLSAGGSPRVAIKGLELAFAELKEAGIDSTGEILDFVTNKFGPEGAKAFRELFEAGIDGADDFASLTADQIAVIASIIKNSGDAFTSFIDGANRFGDAVDDAEHKVRRLKNSVESVGPIAAGGGAQFADGTDIVVGGRGRSSGYRRSRPNNHRAA